MTVKNADSERIVHFSDGLWRQRLQWSYEWTASTAHQTLDHITKPVMQTAL